jgi:hypothetical protein
VTYTPCGLGYEAEPADFEEEALYDSRDFLYRSRCSLFHNRDSGRFLCCR